MFFKDLICGIYLVCIIAAPILIVAVYFIINGANEGLITYKRWNYESIKSI